MGRRAVFGLKTLLFLSPAQFIQHGWTEAVSFARRVVGVICLDEYFRLPAPRRSEKKKKLPNKTGRISAFGKKKSAGTRTKPREMLRSGATKSGPALLKN